MEPSAETLANGKEDLHKAVITTEVRSLDT